MKLTTTTPASKGKSRLLLLTPISGCSGVQSALQPAGKEAIELASLFYVMLIGAVILWILLNGIFFYVTRLNPRKMSRRLTEPLIIGGGIILPVFLLGGLLAYSLPLMGDQRAAGSAATRVKVTGERWWWRVEYLRKDGSVVVAANEIRLPVGERTEVSLTSRKFIHSFWIPALAGKMDMFPGRETRLALEPLKTGTYRGQCAEFCGASHALMAFHAVVMAPIEFEAWLDQQAEPAKEPADDEARLGRTIFLQEGCGACHAIRGTPAGSVFGPDLTHVAGRTALAAGLLPNDAASIQRWIRHSNIMKPDVFMPSYEHLDEERIEALGRYLGGLK